MIRYDIIAEIRLLTTEEGGLHEGLVRECRCIFGFEGLNWECRVYLDDPLAPGNSALVVIGFLTPELLLHRLHIGDPFVLRHARTFAVGTVVLVGRA